MLFKFASDKGQWSDHTCVTFPWINSEGEIVRIKMRSLTQKGKQRLEPKGGGWGLFGWNTIPDDATEIVLTEGEFDAMAVYQVFA